jgi:hypothetical protein
MEIIFSTRAIAPFIGCFETNKASALSTQIAANKKKQIVVNIIALM